MTKEGITKFMGGSPEKIHTVYCGYDEFLQPEPEKALELKEKLGLIGPIIYYIGRIAFYKGVEDIIQLSNSTIRN